MFAPDHFGCGLDFTSTLPDVAEHERHSQDDWLSPPKRSKESFSKATYRRQYVCSEERQGSARDWCFALNGDVKELSEVMNVFTK